MQRRRLGGHEVSAVGLGCATMTPFYDEPDEAAAIETLHRAREIGVDSLDSSDAYGQGRNEELIAGAVKGHRDAYVIASKFGNLRAPDGLADLGRKAGIRQGVLRAQPEAARNRCH
jgi:aryl-alcohol dehydrogenase-like predicted oxidoreductase